MTRTNPEPSAAPYAVLLSHDVDRPFKTYQSLYNAVTGNCGGSRWYHLSTLRPGTNPYWQFDTIMDIESEFGVRSAFYFLSEQSLFKDRRPREWLTKDGWMRYAGRYRLTDPRIESLIDKLDAGGWEVGLHGSFDSFDDRELLKLEKARLENVLGHRVIGCRQHHLNLAIPTTWHHHHSLDLCYDTSLGSSDEVGFQHGYEYKRPFDDEFVVFPLTIMEKALPSPATDLERAWTVIDNLLDEASRHTAVMSVLWHPRTFNEHEFPGQSQLYRRLVNQAIDDGAWVGPPGHYYREAGLQDPST